jgi:hypothetical protein
MKFISSIVLLLAVQLISGKKLRDNITSSNGNVRNRANADLYQYSDAYAKAINNGNNGGAGATANSGNLGVNAIIQSGNLLSA